MTTWTTRSVAALSRAEQKRLFIKARDVYYNSPDSGPIMSDKVFDFLEDCLRKNDPDWVEAQGTGIAPPKKLGKKSKVVLEIPCPSLDKVKPNDAPKLERFHQRIAQKTSMAIMMPKLDGTSLFGVYENGKPVSLSTRGDGITGKDVSFFIPYLNDTFPKKIPDKGRIRVRFEGIVREEVWRKKWSEKVLGEDGFSGDRHMASALFNRQDAHPGLQDVELIAIRVHAPDGAKEWAVSEGLKCAKRNGFKPVPYIEIHTHQLNIPWLTRALENVKAKVPYKIDGLVISSDAIGLRPTGDKPDHAIAFKVDDEDDAPVTVIEEIIWKVSKHGKIVPKARIKPVDFDGVVVSQCALHNPKECKKNGWGVGAQVRVIRSGEIIPKIIETLKPAPFAMPTEKQVGGAWSWDENKTHIYLNNSEEGEAHKGMLAQRFKSTMELLGIEHAAGSMAARLAETGCPDQMSLISALFSDPIKLFKRAGASELMAKKIAATIPKTVMVPVLMNASGMFPEGMGQKRFEKMTSVPGIKWADHDFNKHVDLDLASCKRVLGNVFGQAFFDHYQGFYKRLSKLKHIPLAAPVKKKVAKGPLTGEKVSWTGYRDKAEEKAVEAAGGEVVSFGGQTTILLYRADGKSSSKVEKAKAKGIKVTTFNKLGV